MCLNNIAEASVAIDLAAAWGRCSLLAERHRTEQLRIEAGQLLARLRAGDWSIPEAVYLTYAADARRWSGDGSSVSPSEVLAGAVSRIWADGPRGTPRALALHRRSQTIEGTSVVTLTPPVDGAPRALVALPSFVEREWLAVARAAAHEQGVDIAFTHVGGVKPAVTASSGRAADLSFTVAATQSNLPWTFTFRPREGHADTAPARRQLLWSAFALLAVLWVTASTLILRSVRREFAVARLQADFVAAVSHEFRTPLTTLRQFTERLRAQPDLDKAARLQCYDAQSRATERLSKLVESVLDFGRMEAGARPYAPADRDCAAVVERAVAEFRDTPQAACHPVTLSRNGAMPAALDDEALSRAVTNLLDNAAKYSPDGAAISVTLSSDRGEGRIAVADRGIGIPPDERKRLFLKFQRGDEARRLGIKGTGIGLAMVDHIVRAHAGRVEVESEPGRGSTFTIVLPLKG